MGYVALRRDHTPQYTSGHNRTFFPRNLTWGGFGGFGRHTSDARSFFVSGVVWLSQVN